ncbi:MAG: TonB-dependent receptor [Ignavibacteriae bacterium]|nr:MAG: TonB-dependent receptor [Ignavibacteriota bacterium]
MPGTQNVTRNLLLLLTLIAFSATSAMAQYAVSGRILDEGDGGALPGITVRLVSAADTTKVKGAMTKRDGTFEIGDLPKGPWRFSATGVGFAKYSSTIFIRDRDVSVGSVSMKRDTVGMRAVEVQGEAIAVEIRGDTTQMDARAYKTNENATAEDLVKKMPGITVENGTVRAQGEQVSRVLVDGKRFFGDDASATLKNTPADMIESVQVYDARTDISMFGGFEDGNTEKTINLKTKKDKKTGQFGKFYGGYGTDDRFNAGATYNLFDGPQRITLLGLSNNVNQQNFSVMDLMGSMGMGGGPMSRMMGGFARSGGASRMIRQSGGGLSNLLVDQQGGITTTHALGTNYTDSWSDNVDAEGSYFFNYADNDNSSLTDRTFVEPAGQFYRENTIAQSYSRSHRFNMRINAGLGASDALLFEPRVNHQGSTLNDNVDGVTTNIDTLSTNLTQNTIESEAATIAGTLTYRHRFSAGRTLAASASLNWNIANTDGELTSTNAFIPLDSTTFLDQRSTQAQTGPTYGGSISYTEPISDSSMLQLSYVPNLRYTSSDKQTNSFDSLSGDYTINNPALSNTYDNLYASHRAGALYRLQMGNTIFTVGGEYQYAVLDGQQTFPRQFDITRTFNNVLPSFQWRQRFSMASELTFRYRTSTNAPSITQLQEVVNNTDPLQLSLGNPDLGQSYTHEMTLRFRDADWMAGRALFGFVNVSLVEDFIGSESVVTSADTVVGGVLLPPGATITRPVNLGGNVSARSFFTYTVPAKSLKSNVNLNGGVNYTRVPGMVNGLENIANTTTLNAGFFASSNFSEDIDLSASYNGIYNIVINTLQRQNNANYFNHVVSARLIWNIGPIACSTDVDHTLYSGLGEDFDRNFTVWNAGLGYRFMENNRAEVRLTVFDILRQNTAVNRTVNDISFEDTRTKVLTNYFMLTFSYDLRNFTGGGPGMGGFGPRGR